VAAPRAATPESRPFGIVSFRLARHPQVIVTSHKPTCQELNVSEGTVYRDLAELASQGMRVEGEAGVGYLLNRGFFLPPSYIIHNKSMV
jgi:predicted DNA-binding transcriptional regulator YafY